MRLVAGEDYDPATVAHCRATIRWFAATGQYELIRQWSGREALIRVLHDAALRAVEKPPTKPYRRSQMLRGPVVRRPVGPALMGNPEDMVTDEEVEAWVDDAFPRSGLKRDVAACLAYLERDFGGRK